jgi:hypothetical protein
MSPSVTKTTRRSQNLKRRILVSHFVMSVAIAAVLFGIDTRVAAATPEIRGTPSEMQLHTQETSVRQILDALARSFNFTYQLPPSVNRMISGRYSGSLSQILGRILDGHSYIIRQVEGGAEVVVLSTAGPTGIAAPVAIDPVASDASKPTSQSTQTLPSTQPTGEATSPVARPLSSFR